MNKITSVCVYCASSTKIDSAYFEAARELGTLLGQRHISSAPADRQSRMLPHGSLSP